MGGGGGGGGGTAYFQNLANKKQGAIMHDGKIITIFIAFQDLEKLLSSFQVHIAISAFPCLRFGKMILLYWHLGSLCGDIEQ